LAEDKVTIFISHVSEDKELALRMKAWLLLLFKDRVDVFVSNDWTSIEPGDSWMDRILTALKSAKVLIALLTPQSIRRNWIYFEAGAAKSAGARVIPVCAKDLSISALVPPLSMWQACELRNKQDIIGLAELLVKFVPNASVSSSTLWIDILNLSEFTESNQPIQQLHYDHHRVSPLPPPEGVLMEMNSYDSLVESLALEIIKEYSEHHGQKFWVGISGPRQSGKTTLAMHILQRLKSEIPNIVAFAEDDFYLPRSQRNLWKEKYDSRFPNQKNWLRWDILTKWFTTFDQGTGEFVMKDLYDLSDGRVHLYRSVNVTPDTLFLYEGQFLEDTERYPPDRFDLLVRLAVNFETSLKRSLDKDARRGLSHDTIVFMDNIVYQPSLWLHVGQFHPERKAALVVDTTEFERPILLQYDGLAE
jgi:uridine kinase